MKSLKEKIDNYAKNNLLGFLAYVFFAFFVVLVVFIICYAFISPYPEDMTFIPPMIAIGCLILFVMLSIISIFARKKKDVLENPPAVHNNYQTTSIIFLVLFLFLIIVRPDTQSDFASGSVSILVFVSPVISLIYAIKSVIRRHSSASILILALSSLSVVAILCVSYFAMFILD